MLDILNKKEAIIFDMDGTLVDSMWVWKDIDIEFLAERGMLFPEEFQSEIEGMSFTETAQYSKKRFQLKESVEELKAIWNYMAIDKYSHEVHFKPGAELFLQYCKEQGIPMGIATSNSIELVEAVAESKKLRDYIEVIVTSCEVPRGKPNPDVYLEVAARLGVNPKECLAFEDVPMGIMAARNAGLVVCAVDDDFSKGQVAEKKELADYYIHDYQQVLDGTYEILEKK
jgi:HAD superfamily hydrolase (TIGR01509 family)